MPTLFLFGSAAAIVLGGFWAFLKLVGPHRDPGDAEDESEGTLLSIDDDLDDDYGDRRD